jgi:dTDP-4-amino-4,6-dideoxygalactose transaminase
MPVPLTRPNPPRLSEAAAELRKIEDRGIFSNFGPVNTQFEQEMISRMFGGVGACVTVCNATIGLMLAIKQATADFPPTRRYALMPSFTFAAAAQAAMWCGLTPLFCDIDPQDWAASAAAEDAALARYGDSIAVIVPYATFGFDIDLKRYTDITDRLGIPVVVDAAASLGTISADGRGFGTGYRGSIVYSMHATKSFATGEAGIIYSADEAAITQQRQMCNFGFGKPRNATMLGLNGKLSEVGALLGQLRLADYDAVMEHRAELVKEYRRALPDLSFQPARPHRQAHQFCSALLPRDLASQRDDINASLAADGIGSAHYFSPHVMEQDYFIQHGVSDALPVTDDVASRIISLPLYDTMTMADLDTVVTAVAWQLARRRGARKSARRIRAQPTPVSAPVPMAQMVVGFTENGLGKSTAA